jgi:hypothetical protein
LDVRNGLIPSNQSRSAALKFSFAAHALSCISEEPALGRIRCVAAFGAACNMVVDEDMMDTTIDRIMKTYDILVNRSAAANDEARAKVTTYLTMLTDGGETDPHRLTVCGLTYLRQLDGSSDPVKAGYTGL